jgi:acyl carrier protein
MNFLSWLNSFVQPKPMMYVSDSEWAVEHFPAEQREVAICVARALVEYLNIRLDDIKATTRFINDLQMGDLEPMEVLTALEAALHISIPVHETWDLETVSDLVQYLQAKVRAGES